MVYSPAHLFILLHTSLQPVSEKDMALDLVLPHLLKYITPLRFCSFPSIIILLHSIGNFHSAQFFSVQRTSVLYPPSNNSLHWLSPLPHAAPWSFSPLKSSMLSTPLNCSCQHYPWPTSWEFSGHFSALILLCISLWYSILLTPACSQELHLFLFS